MSALARSQRPTTTRVRWAIALGVGLVGLVLAAGCALTPLGGRPTGAPGGSRSPMGSDLRVWRVAFHCHSKLSHDSDGSFERIARSAREVGVDAVILTDHYEHGNMSKAPRGLLDGVLLVPGVEIRGMGGSLLAFGFRSEFPRKDPPEELIARFRAEGGLVVAGHIERIDEWSLPVDGIEILNLHATVEAQSVLSILGRAVVLPPDRFFESALEYPAENIATWDRLLRDGRRLPPLLGCDAHENIALFGITVGTYAELFRLFSNHVLAAELTEEAIVDAIRHGRLYCVFDHLGDASGFSVTYGRPEDRETRTIVGGTAPHEPASMLEVIVPREAEIRVVRDGERLATVLGTRLEQRLPGAGVYRVEVFLDDRPWIVSSPIRIEDRPPSPRPVKTD